MVNGTMIFVTGKDIYHVIDKSTVRHGRESTKVISFRISLVATESIYIRMGQVSKGSGSMMSPEMVTGPFSIQMEVSFMVSAPFNTQRTNLLRLMDFP